MLVVPRYLEIHPPIIRTALSLGRHAAAHPSRLWAVGSTFS